MANKCVDCEFFKGADEKCGVGKTGYNAHSTACSDSFKGPASLFEGKRCGGCKLFKGGNNAKCGGGQIGCVTTKTACGGSYVPIDG